MVTDNKQALQNIYEHISEQFDAGVSGGVLMSEMCAGVDKMLVEMWLECAPHAAEVVDLVAVGGYGRAELAPQSDWDIWFLLPDSMPKEHEEEIQTFLYALWDMNAKIGHAVRTVKQTIDHVREDWNSATAAMESRLLHGSGHQHDELSLKLEGFFKKQRKAFVEAKMTEVESRHKTTGGTAFLMEPDLKEGQGGLRDVQASFWIAKAWYQSSDVDDLVEKGALSSMELEHLLSAQDFLWRCRAGLHLETKRVGDRLSFELQAVLAERMGYQATDHRPAVDAFMKDYFRHAGRIVRVSGMLWMHFQEQLHPQYFKFTKNIEDGFTLEGQRVGLQHANVFKDEPLRLLRIFHIAQKDQRHLSSEALRQIREDVLLIDDDFRANQEAHGFFLGILRDGRNVAWALKEMNDTGVLGRFIPEFRNIVGLGQFNRYHAYTVDEHTIRAIGEARNMFHAERGTRLPLACDVIRKLKRPELLYIALLFHDIAKGEPGDHSEVGAVMARDFCRRIHLSEDAVELVSWLVQEHLTMAVKSQRFDLSDPDVIHSFAERMGEVGRLNYLLCLTIADIAAVGPNVWNDWKGSLLRDIYVATERVFMGEDIGGEALQDNIRRRVESTLAKASGDRDGLKTSLDLMPWRCQMHFPPRQLLHLAELLLHSNKGEDVAWFVDERRCETMVMVVADERPGLFAILTTAIAMGHVSVVAAQAYELNDGRALDVFHIQSDDGAEFTDENDLLRLKTRIKKALGQENALQEPAVQRFKRSVLMEQVQVRVRELPLASSVQTAIEVSAANRPGLLAQLAYQISVSGYYLRGATISTFGERAVDVFFVQGKDSAQLSTDEMERLHHQLMNVATLPEVL